MNQDVNKILENEIKEIITLYNHKNFEEALSLSNKLINREKEVPFLLNLNGLINLSLEKWQKAIIVFKKAIDCDNNFVEAFNNLGVAYSHLGEHDEAVEHYTKAIKIKKDYSNGYNNLASHYDDLGQYNDAAKYYIAALKFNPKHPQAQNNLIHLMNFYQARDFEENTIIETNKKIKEMNSNISIYNNIKIGDMSEYFLKINQIIKNNLKTLSFNDTQIFRRNNYDLNCNRHFKVFNKFNVIPKYCFSCFKIQIELKTVTQLFKLFFIFDQLKLPSDNIRKCFIELRPGIPGTYKGLIYCASMDEARDVFSILSPYIQKFIKNDLHIAIKRGCTEFDLAFPGYKDTSNLDKVSFNNEWEQFEKITDIEIKNGSKKGKKVFNRTLSGTCIGDVLIMNNWLNYAKLIGDETYNDISNEMFNSQYIYNIVKKRDTKN